MSSRIDGQTMVPLDVMVKALAFFFTVGMGVTATGAVWVYRVNDRLFRIERKLGISEVPTDLIAGAEADTGYQHRHGRGLAGHESETQ